MKSFRQYFPVNSMSFIQGWFGVSNSEPVAEGFPFKLNHKRSIPSDDHISESSNPRNATSLTYQKIYNSHKKEHGKSWTIQYPTHYQAELFNLLYLRAASFSPQDLNKMHKTAVLAKTKPRFSPPPWREECQWWILKPASVFKIRTPPKK